MNKRLIATLMGLVTIVGLTTVSAMPATAASVRPLIDCTQSPGANIHRAAHFTGNGVNIRTGPGTSCTAVGSGFKTDSVTVHCQHTNSTTFEVWYYLKDNTTGKIGWADSAFVSVVTVPSIYLC